tara:strand:- start:4244 stop:5287 length:1044 start_codon:yes stop_codon:yes gene_type:complete
MKSQKQSLKEKVIGKLKQYGVPGLAVVGALALLMVVFGGFNSFHPSGIGFSDSATVQNMPGVPSMGRGGSFGAEKMFYAEEMAIEGGYIQPIPDPSPYVPELEKYETTDYRVSARTRQFDEACSLLRALKADTRIDFKSISEGLNRCSGTFYADEAQSAWVLDKLNGIAGVEINRQTVSVTRHRENLQTEAGVLREQLAVVERTLTQAESQYEEITEVARVASDASALTEAIRDKLSMIKTLNNERIQLLARLRSISQQSSDLEERIGVVAFSASFTRSYPVDLDENSRKWEAAWENLNDAFIDFMMAFTVNLGIFLLKVIQYVVYGLILLVFVRVGYRVVRRLWQI